MKVNEIFFSIQGESTYAGLFCAFVRLSGCNLRCAYCDTKYAYEEGVEQSITQIKNSAARFPAKLVEITGGEPLLQADTPALITAFADAGYKVLVETNGSVPLRGRDERAIVIMDIKCPGSGMSEHVLWDNIDLLSPLDEIKFVLTDQADYDWALNVIERYRLNEEHAVHLSPAFGILEPRRLASWMLESRIPGGGLNVRFHLQLHKYIWPHREKGV